MAPNRKIYILIGLLFTMIYTMSAQSHPLMATKVKSNHYRADRGWSQYTWFDCEDNMPVDSGRHFKSETSGNYFLVAIDKNGYSDTTSCFNLRPKDTSKKDTIGIQMILAILSIYVMAVLNESGI